LSALSCSKRQQVLPDSTIEHITQAVSTSEKDRPDVRAAARLDWAAFARQLPWRLRRILKWLAIGARKSWIAKRLGISNGRVSQLIAKLAGEITAFFGPEVVPAGCHA
jgi:DNA-directed RNA polymerase specialized sigma subunit